MCAWRLKKNMRRISSIEGNRVKLPFLIQNIIELSACLIKKRLKRACVQSILAIADPTRRRIVELLAQRERTAGELVDEFDVSASAISQHLKVLREAGLVTVRAEGQSRVQSLSPEGFGDLVSWLENTRSVWSRRLDALERELRPDDESNKQRHKKKSPQ